MVVVGEAREPEVVLDVAGVCARKEVLEGPGDVHGAVDDVVDQVCVRAAYFSRRRTLSRSSAGRV